MYKQVAVSCSYSYNTNLFKMNCVYIFIIVVLQYFVNDVRAGFSCEVPCTPNNTPHDVPDYYWREYTGVIPRDAVPGGVDKVGNPTYMGQLYTQEWGLLPATIYSGCKSARTTQGNKERQSDKNVKILCSNLQDKLAWVATSDPNFLTNCHLVKAGSEVDYNLYFGRVNYNDQTIVGKAFGDGQYKGLWVPDDNGSDTRFSTYEILTYNCERHGPRHHQEHFSFTDFLTQKSK